MSAALQRVQYGLTRLRYFQSFGRAAVDWHERWTVLRYATYDLAGRASPLFRPPPGEPRVLSLDLNGAHHFVALGRNEDLALHELYVSRVYERLDDFVPRPGWTVLDLGANVGMFSVQQARRGARVYAFEPNPDCFRRFARAIEANGLSELIFARNVALGRTVGRGQLVVGQSSLAGSLHADKIPEAQRSKTFSVEVTTVDECVKDVGIQHIDLMKVDTEWAELDVLAGAEDVLRNVDRIVMECHTPEIADQAEEFLFDRGFELALRDRTYDEAGYCNLHFRHLHGTDC